MLLSLWKVRVNRICRRREGSGGRSETSEGKCGGDRTIVPLSMFSVYTRDVGHSSWKVKGKLVPLCAMKPYMGSRGITPLVLNHAQYGGERFKFTSSVPPLYTLENSEYEAGWAPQSLWTVLKKRPVPLPGFKHLIVQASGSRSCSQLFADPLGCAIICHGILGCISVMDTMKFTYLLISWIIFTVSPCISIH